MHANTHSNLLGQTLSLFIYLWSLQPFVVRLPSCTIPIARLIAIRWTDVFTAFSLPFYFRSRRFDNFDFLYLGWMRIFPRILRWCNVTYLSLSKLSGATIEKYGRVNLTKSRQNHRCRLWLNGWTVKSPLQWWNETDQKWERQPL